MILAGYLRVSTELQASDGLGLEVQRAAIATWAAANGHEIASWHADAGVSGTTELEGRVALGVVLESIRTGTVAGLVVTRLDRLARDLLVQETILRDVRRFGGTTHSTSATEAAYLGDDPSDPARKLIRQILGALSEYERALVTLRLQGGRATKAAKGGFAYGAPPFGYKSEGGVLVEVPDEAAAVSVMRTLRDGGASLRAVAAHLDATGTRPRRGVSWHPNTVREILRRT